jgi:hypothetical protein
MIEFADPLDDKNKIICELQSRVRELEDGIRNIPWNDYREALRNGCDSDGAWHSFCDACREHLRKLLEVV